ncbi:MAG: hypothetical protein WA736_10450 [Candidatus Acidiferrum sp.]
MSAKQNLYPPRSRSLIVFCHLLGFVLLFLPSFLRAESLEDAAHELAMKVCATARKQQVRVHWLDSPDSTGYLSNSLKKVFLEQITACGMEPIDSPEATLIKVAIQITASRVLLIADAEDSAGVRQVYMIEIPRASLQVARETSPAPQLQRELLFQQEKPIRDAVEWQDPATQERYLFFLSENRLIRRRFENGAWKLVDSTDLPAGNHRLRFEDGRFIYMPTEEKLAIVLHHKMCDFDPVDRASFSCSARIYDEKSVGISSSCEDYFRLLDTGKGDYTQPDRITLSNPISIHGEVANLLNGDYSSSLDVPGPVLRLSVGKNSKTAFAVVRNLLTGTYEVYRITAICGN